LCKTFFAPINIYRVTLEMRAETHECQVSYSFFFTDYTLNWNVSTNFVLELCSVKFNGNPFGSSLFVTCGQRDMTYFCNDPSETSIWCLNGHFSTITLVPGLFRQFKCWTTFVLTPKTPYEINACMAGRDCVSAPLNSSTAGRILVKFGICVMLLRTTPNSYFLISYMSPGRTHELVMWVRN
jgi:hypothetical protein